MKESYFKDSFCSKEVKVKSCFPHPWRERVGGARERGNKLFSPLLPCGHLSPQGGKRMADLRSLNY